MKSKQKSVAAKLLVLSPKRKKIFLAITVFLPFVLLLVLEIGLRVFHYGGDLRLFIDGPPGYEKYLRCNPNVARRYFSALTTIPTPPKQLFLKQKPVNGYRIFVLGESSAAGFPYGENASFPNILQRTLSNAFPQKEIEVVTVAFAAINSYTLADLVDEILQQSPDALLIYTGHNEYYGALGVGSAQSLSNSRWLIRTYLKLESLKVFLLMRDFFGWAKIRIAGMFGKGSEIDPTATLMESIVADQSIPYGNPLYEAGKEQFKENMEEILRRAAQKNVRVVLSELVSNVRDQEPFVSLEEKNGESAKTVFQSARQFEAEGQLEKAREYYYRAKDLDALRFRAPEDFNVILKQLSQQYSVPLVPMESCFENESPHGIIGSSLILEHLHPNYEGYFLMAKAFYDALEHNRFIDQAWPAVDCISRENHRGFTELDSVNAALTVRRLKGSWPFQPKGLPNRFAQYFRPANYIEDIVWRTMQNQNFSLESAHMALGEYYEKRGELDKAFAEYYALVVSIPQEMEFYRKAAMVLLKKQAYDEASQLLRRSLRYGETDFADKWIGQIALMKNNYAEAISFLKKADLYDPQVLFNLSRACYLNDQWSSGEEWYLRLQGIAPRSEYAAYLTNLRSTIQKKQQTKQPSSSH
jgi:tetratricopeptide (TPR) repeat protein